MHPRQFLPQTKDAHAVSQTQNPTNQQSPDALRRAVPPIALIQRALAAPGSLSRANVLQLQRAIGNRAVGSLVTGGRPTLSARTKQRQDEREQENTTGLPDYLKAGIETLSGLSLDAVKVRYNSSKPAQLQALAYTQGAEIHVGPGQEKHLPHEAWHVVQQAQGRVLPTMQMKGGVSVNDDEGLEHEADMMGAKAVQMGCSEKEVLKSASSPALKPGRILNNQPIQRFLDDVIYPERKMGAEVTEATAGNNRLETADAIGAVAHLWTHTVYLPDDNGNNSVWFVEPTAVIGAQFNFRQDKNNWMRWGDVSMTEDTGEFEWIIHHPATPQKMSYYRARLNEVNQNRQHVRAQLGHFGADLVMSTFPNPAAGQAFRIQLGATNAASSQITFESIDPTITKKVLYEGVSHGLNKRTRPNRETLADVTPEIVIAAQTSANRIAYPGIDKELLMAYLYGDLIHKMATLVNGVGWGIGQFGNIKGWRNLFPKSKPFQVTIQAFGAVPTHPQLNMLRLALTGQQAPIIQDIVGLFAAKLSSTARVLYTGAHFGLGVPDPGNAIFTAANAGVAPLGGAGALVPLLGPFFLHHGLNLNTEYNNVRDAFTTSTTSMPLFVPQVVRSSNTGFAQHTPGTSGFATEDRGEVQTTFPGLDTTYDRIKALAWRF